LSTSGYSSLTNKLPPLAILCVAALCTFHCKGEMYLGLDRDRFAEKLAQGDYSFFDKLDPKRLPGGEIFSYAPGAGYFLGLAAQDRGRPDLAAHFLGLEADAGAAPGGATPGAGIQYAPWAVRELLEVLNSSDRYAETRSRAAAWLAAYPDSPVNDRVRFREIEAAYWQKDDAAVLEKIDAYFSGGAAALTAIDPELLLFKTVSSTRLGKAGWEDMIRDFFESLRASSLHQRLYSYLEIEKEKLASFTAFERELFKAKALSGDGRQRAAALAFEPLLPKLAPAVLARGVYTADFAAAVAAEQPSSRQADILSGLAGRLKGEERAVLLEAAGRIHLLAKNNIKSKITNEAAFRASGDPLRRKRVLHRLLTSGVELGADTTLALLKEYGARIDDPGYFDDVFDAFVNRLVRERRYQTLVELAQATPAFWPATEKNQLAYVGARILMTGLADAPKKESLIKTCLTTAGQGNVRGYYSFLSAFFLSDTARVESFFKAAPGPAAAKPEKLSEQELLLDGLFQFGLYRRALGGIAIAKHEVNNQTIAWWAESLAARNRPYEAIQLVSLLRSRDPAALTRRDYTAYYPRAFASLIAPAAAEYGIDESLYFSLIRQESAFHSGIGSSAGAVGLTQLMPDTGRWLAGLLKVENADLTDPATSVRFGAYYLDFLHKRLDTLPFILAGYNGGPTNARRWKLRYDQLPPDLAVEALDFTETRDFIKSIFSARVIYGLMYGDTGIRDGARLFYNF
jgi:soluble lytic murein transglycosylase-like protein